MKIPQIIKEWVEELRRHPTNAEAALFPPLRFLCHHHHIPLIFQCPLPYSRGWAIIDFVLGKKMGIELDGKHHIEDSLQRAHDRDRDSRLEWEYDFKIVRIPNSRISEEGPFSIAIEIVDLVLDKLGRKREEGREELQVLWDQFILKAFQLGLLAPP